MSWPPRELQPTPILINAQCSVKPKIHYQVKYLMFPFYAVGISPKNYPRRYQCEDGKKWERQQKQNVECRM